MITKKNVEEAQKIWAQGVIKIGSLKDSRKECEEFSSKFLDECYDFDNTVLFKPTKCEHEQFRDNKEGALSYFIAGDERKCKEDKGFALQPWVRVRFENTDMIIEKNRAIAMGNYFFVDTDNNEVKVEYTFSYKLIEGKLKIDVHHSSLPYKNN